ncbi:MAG: hypothetical protein AABX34_00985 [Nanoarchaeota archaeon]
MGKIIKYGIITLAGVTLLGVAYFMAVVGSAAVVNDMSPIIRTESKLERIVEIERKKLGLDSSVIIKTELITHGKARSGKVGKNKYLIQLGGGLATQEGVQHELYHIYDGHLENLSSGPLKTLKYLFWYEPQAALYQVFGLKP